MRKKAFITIFCISIILLELFVDYLPADAYMQYDSFHYVYNKGKIQKSTCPAPFYPLEVVDSVSIDAELSNPSDITVDKENCYYIADSGTNKILKFSADWKVLKEFKQSNYDDVIEPFKQPQGVWVTEDGKIYVADTENNRIVILDQEGNTIQVILQPDSEILEADYKFYPKKLSVDKAGRIFVVARDQFNGIMEFDHTGEFLGFIGSNQVVASPLEIFWRKIMTKEQRGKMLQMIPLEYSSLCMDDDGFIYAVTTATDEKKKIRRLNPGGKDILVRSEYSEFITKYSMIEDVCVDEKGNYYYIDKADGNIYTYNKDGYLLYAFGNLSNQKGTFKSPTAIEYSDGKLYVTDAVAGNITVYKRTEYADQIDKASNFYIDADYEESRIAWEEVLRLNCNFELAYIQIGRVLYRQEQYGQAMEYFKRGNFKGENYVSGYGTAFEAYRSEYLRRNLGKILSIASIIALISIVAVIAYKYSSRKKRRKIDNDI